MKTVCIEAILSVISKGQRFKLLALMLDLFINVKGYKKAYERGMFICWCLVATEEQNFNFRNRYLDSTVICF